MFNKPRDVVSGDFTWVDNVEGREIIIVADCTGHGVTGALLSMLGTSLITQIIKRNHIYNPASILVELNKEFLKLYDNFSTLNDGMDLSVTVIHPTENGQKEIQYAGARSQIVLIDKDGVRVMKPTRTSIGEEKVPVFTAHSITIENKTYAFQFTDGYRDQIGGPKNKKLMTKGFYRLLEQSIDIKTVGNKIEFFQTFLENWKNEKQLNEQIDDIMIVGYEL